MSVANTSQLLIKNLDLLKAQTPLFINISADLFVEEYKAAYPDAQLSFYNHHYGEYLAHQKKQHDVQFSHQYTANKQHDVVVILFPKSKAELAYTLAMLDDVVTNETLVYFVGEKNSGVKSVEKLAKGFLQHCQKDDAARHCMLFSGCYINQTQPFNLDDWYKSYPVNVHDKTINVFALPGVFSQEKLDVGTRVLLEFLPDYSDASVLDFGCGAGVIAAYIASKDKNVTLSLADVSALALASAEKTLSQLNIKANFIATDSMSNITNAFDHVISNPPFHQGLKTHYQATENFLDNIVNHINKHGSLTIVANSFLKYQPIMEKRFNSVKQLIKANGFAVYSAKR